MDDVRRVEEAVAEAAATVADAAKEAVAAAADTAATAGAKIAGASALRPLPEDRVQLLTLHRDARHRRDAAPLTSHERARASFELERIEVQIARIERAMDPPRV